MLDRYSKLVRASTLPKSIALHVVIVFLENRTVPNSIPNTIMTNNVPRIVSECFVALCASIGTKPVTATEYYLQTSVNGKRFNKALPASPWHCIGNWQTDWDNYMQSQTYGCETRVHRTTKTSFVSLKICWVPHGATVNRKRRTPEEYNIILGMLGNLIALCHLMALKKKADQASHKAGKSLERYFNETLQHLLVFKTGDWFYLGEPPDLMKDKIETTMQDSSAMLFSKRGESFRVLQTWNTTATVDFNELWSVVSIDRIMKAEAVKERSDNVLLEARYFRDRKCRGAYCLSRRILKTS